MLRVIDDGEYEGEETINLTASGDGTSPLGHSQPLVVGLVDDETLPLTLTVAPDSVGEAAGQRLATVTVSVPAEAALAADLTVTLLHTGTATVATGDYTVETLTIEADQNRPTPSSPFTATATLEVVDDGDYEKEETIRLQASAPAPGYAASDVVEIALADDELPPLTLTVDQTGVSEPSGTAQVTVTVPAGEEPASDATITLVQTGTATAESGDYTVETLTILKGGTSGSATLTVSDDTVYEGAETIALQATHSDYQASGVVEIALADDEKVPLTLTADRTSVSEPDGTTEATVTVPAGAAPAEDTTIGIWDVGYARLGEDYRVGTVTINKGDLSGSATLEVIDDGVYEGTEQIRIQAAKTGYKISPVLEMPLIDNDPNGAPVVSSPIPDLTINVSDEQTVTLSSHFSDPEGHDLAYTATADESVVTVSVNAGILTVTGAGVGKTEVTVTATDQVKDTQDRLSVSDRFTVTVPNRDPECEAIEDQTVNVNVWKALTVSCSDPDGHSLEYEPSSMDTSTVDTTTPNPLQSSFSLIGVAVGTATVTVTVTDGHGGSEEVTITVTVPNLPPECSDIPSQTLLVGESRTVDLSQYCSDPDGHDLSYVVTSSETDQVTASVNGNTLTITGVEVGESVVTVTASDDPGNPEDSLSTTTAFTATVENRDPVCEAIADQTVTAGTSKTVAVSCSDPDGHSLEYDPQLLESEQGDGFDGRGQLDDHRGCRGDGDGDGDGERRTPRVGRGGLHRDGAEPAAGMRGHCRPDGQRERFRYGDRFLQRSRRARPGLYGRLLESEQGDGVE